VPLWGKAPTGRHSVAVRREAALPSAAAYPSGVSGARSAPPQPDPPASAVAVIDLRPREPETAANPGSPRPSWTAGVDAQADGEDGGAPPGTSPIAGRLGGLLTAQASVDPVRLAQALGQQPGSGLRLGELLVRMGAVDEAALTGALAGQFGVPSLDLGRQLPDPTAAGRLPEGLARELIVLPLREVDGALEVIAGDLRPGLEDAVRAGVGGPVRLYAAAPSAVRQAIDRTYRALGDVEGLVNAFVAGDGTRTSALRVKEDPSAESAPIAQLVTKLITQGLRDRASDIHIEPSDQQLRVRYRIDGALIDALQLPMTVASPLVSRVKILANMNIVERRRAQDGQFSTEVDGRGVDIRVSTMATVFGEKCVMRLLDKTRSVYKLDQLGMPDAVHTAYSNMARSPFGMVVSAGPTGSGKTTTLYATLSEIDERSRNIVTIEDPVEYIFPTINQVQTNEQAGLTFADGLKAVLRQDPDIILVGEIRDIETARTAVQAALTGHFVLSSLHATDSVAALHRFLDMGIEAFLVASSLLGIMSQRLVRRICANCTAPYEPSPEEMSFYQETGGAPKSVFVRGRGCHICAGTGYQDRVGVYEFLRMTPEIRRLLVGWATQDELRKVATNQGMRTLRQAGLDLVAQDATTISEVVRNIHSL
jgi:type IV pilus assembly protein PilB